MVDKIRTVYRVLPVDTKYPRTPAPDPVDWPKNKERRKRRDRRNAFAEGREVYDMRSSKGRRKGDRKNSTFEIKV